LRENDGYYVTEIFTFGLAEGTRAWERGWRREEEKAKQKRRREMAKENEGVEKG